jgi:hypothetical protein
MQWSRKTKKKIRPIFLTYSNGQYVLTEFAIGACYGQLEIVSNRAFTINDSGAAVINLAEALQAVSVEGEPEQIPFPQANDLDKVVDTVQLIDFGVNTITAIAEFFEFDERQAYYYTDAARYLGLVEKSQQAFVLTDGGKDFLTMFARAQRTKAIFRQIIRRPSCRGALVLVANQNFDLSKIKDRDFADIIQQYSSLSPSTALRRASTLRKWFKWLLKNSVMQ